MSVGIETPRKSAFVLQDKTQLGVAGLLWKMQRMAHNPKYVQLSVQQIFPSKHVGRIPTIVLAKHGAETILRRATIQNVWCLLKFEATRSLLLNRQRHATAYGTIHICVCAYVGLVASLN